MTREEFEVREAGEGKPGGMPVAEWRRRYVAVACGCGQPVCAGWVTEARGAFYRASTGEVWTDGVPLPGNAADTPHVVEGRPCR
jgi:hypothetical protein